MRYCPSSIGRKYCNVIALGKLALTDVQAAGLNSQIISTGPVTSRMNTADYLIAVTDSADPALTASASTYSGNVTVYNRNGNAMELTDASTFDGDITAYSEKGSAFRLSGSEACVWFKTEADKGWYVKSVKLNGSEITPDNDGKYRFIMTRDSELVVEAEQRKYTLTVTSGENGTVTPGSGEFISGTEVTLTVAPDEGYQVKSVTLNGSAVELTNGKYTFALTENSVFAAEFEKKPSSGNGGHSGGSAASRPSSTASTENTPSLNGSNMSWSEAASRIRQAASGASLVIELNCETTVPADVIKAVSERGVSVEFVVDSTKSWIIDGAEISSAANADLTAVPGNADNSALRGVSGFDLKISGTNVPAGLKLVFRREFAGQFANVYKLTDGGLVFQRSVKIGTDGCAVISGMDKAGEYIVMACAFSDQLGDMNNDGVLNALDAAAILKAVINSEAGSNPLMADFNGDGKVNALDASAILKLVIGMA